MSSAQPAALRLLEVETLPGLASFARQELHRWRSAYTLLPPTTDDAVRLTVHGPITDLLSLRVAHAVYACRSVASRAPSGLLGHQTFAAILQDIAVARSAWPTERFRTLRISAPGSDSAVFRRFQDAIVDQTGLVPTDGPGDLLIRARRAGPSGWEVLTRLSPRPLSARPWRVANLPGALDATIAAAMVMLSDPQPTDRVINLACGSGTILIERLLRGPARSAIGADTDATAIAAAHANLAAAGLTRSARLLCHDATDLPLESGDATALFADLPWGQLIGSHRSNTALYPKIFREAARLAAAGARFVVVSAERRLLEATARDFASRWEGVHTMVVSNGGQRLQVLALRRRD